MELAMVAGIPTWSHRVVIVAASLDRTMQKDW
jgi:hypothetical protein